MPAWADPIDFTFTMSSSSKTNFGLAAHSPRYPVRSPDAHD
ncbi:hypothetical protein [Mycobacterium sp.]|nr:hypothetical protein [Mycobacterium sp.]HTQ20911.1 hypothetical protein [Mycobacterium sp.]